MLELNIFITSSDTYYVSIEMSEKVDETIARARRMSEKIDESVHERIDDLSKTMLEQQKLIDDFIHEKPYVSMGVGFLAGLGLGIVLGHLTRGRRD
jgi:ElaB/YqjD/DUF883 family membrane-anchored ribosome-binding protein